MAIALKDGVKITVDLSDIDTKFTRTIEQLNTRLSASQKALRMQYNEQGVLVDSLGRCVEGLSLWQIKLGMWIDETAKARTIAGGYADGLSRIELELGYYANELGEVCDRQEKVIRKTKEALAAENEQSEALQRSRQALSDAFDAIGDGAGRLASLASQFESLGEGANGFRDSLIRI